MAFSMSWVFRLHQYSSMNCSESGCPLSSSMALALLGGVKMSSSARVVGLYQYIVEPPLTPKKLTLDEQYTKAGAHDRPSLFDPQRAPTQNVCCPASITDRRDNCLLLTPRTSGSCRIAKGPEPLIIGAPALLIPQLLWVSEKNSSRKLAEQSSLSYAPLPLDTRGRTRRSIKSSSSFPM